MKSPIVQSEKAYLVYPTGYHVAKVPIKNRQIDFHTHVSPHAERLHQVSEFVMMPARLAAQSLARITQPLAGAHKNSKLLGLAKRVTAVAVLILIIPFAILSLILGVPLRIIDHQFRPAISYIDNSSSTNSKAKKNLEMTQENPLHIRTHNLGFVATTMSIAGDLRDPVERAHELVVSINGDTQKPDIIFFQETFHEDATKVLCEGIKDEYPYIIHSVAPGLTGFSSGALIASKYPLEQIEFQKLHHMQGPERATARGVIKVALSSSKGPVFLYGVHTQALIGEKRAEARHKQLEQIKKMMDDDLIKNPDAVQVLMGDFNTSRVTAWGEDNITGKGQKESGQAEMKVLNRLSQYFKDPFLKDHHKRTGLRIRGTGSHFLKADNERMGVNLNEPSGSWFHGPFAEPGLILSKKMRNDRKVHGRGAPEKAKGINIDKSTWGTSKWHEHQTANTARFDYVLLPKNDEKLDAIVEIRRPFVPKGTQSAPSDHLPVDAMVWRKYTATH